MNKTTYNTIGAEMIENRLTKSTLDLDLLTSYERKSYISICDEIADSAYALMSSNNHDDFPAFRSALHKLFTFVETETRILSLDAYSLRFIPAVVPYKTFKSKAYKDAEKAIRVFKNAMEWACEVSNVDMTNDESELFPKAKNSAQFQTEYYSADVQDSYNAIVGMFVTNNALKVSDLKAHLQTLEDARDNLAKVPGNFYNDFKDPMKSSTGKRLSHAPESVRKGIEDAMADLLTQRELMTSAQLDKEEAQIIGGKKQAKQAKSANK